MIISKKLIVILFSLLISFNSYSETLVCSEISNGQIYTSTYTRQGDKFISGGEYSSESRIAYELDYYLALETYMGNEGTWLFHYNKLSKDFKSTIFSVNYPMTIYEGKCESIP